MDEINLLVVFADGSEKTVTLSASDIVAFEAKFDRSIDGVERFTHFAFLAWHSEFRIKATGHEFETWIDTVKIVKEADPKGL